MATNAETTAAEIEKLHHDWIAGRSRLDREIVHVEALDAIMRYLRENGAGVVADAYESAALEVPFWTA